MNVLKTNSSLNKLKPLKTRLLFFVFFGLLVSFKSCKPSPLVVDQPIKKGMIKVSILYPYEEGKTFDMDYYAKKHMPWVADLFGDSLKHYTIDKGLSGRTAEEAVPYVAVGSFYFITLSAYENSFGPNADKILSDIPNYTNITPVVQISNVIQ